VPDEAPPQDLHDTGDDIMIEDENIFSPVRPKNVIADSPSIRIEQEPIPGHLTDESSSPATKTCYVCNKSLDHLDIQVQSPTNFIFLNHLLDLTSNLF
jgi:hypothetical protein